MTEKEVAYEARREAAPAVIVAILALVALALVSKAEGWKLLGLAWWIWLVLALPGLALTLDLALASRGAGLVRTRRLALALVRLLALGNLIGLGLLVAGLVTTSTDDLGGAELLLSALVILVNNVIVFGLWFWEIDDGGPIARTSGRRTTPDFQFPQDENPGLARPDWRPTVWDYFYVSLTNSIAFSPTDAMPLSPHAKALMGLESAISIVAVVLVTARAVNVLGS